MLTALISGAPERGDVVLAAAVVAVEDVRDAGDLVQHAQHPRHVGHHEHRHQRHHHHRHADLVPAAGNTRINASWRHVIITTRGASALRLNQRSDSLTKTWLNIGTRTATDHC